MDKEEFRIKLDEINNLVEKQDYKGAMGVVDSIDWHRVKNVRTLTVVGEIYAANKRYDDSKEIFLLAYHRAPIGKNILYRLIEVSLKMGEIDEAREYFEEFVDIAPNDNTRYILQYKIDREEHLPVEELIHILEEYKEKEFTERWAYELAKLYYQAGKNDKCISLVDEMVLWFSDGKYVAKALELKNRCLGVEAPKKEENVEKEALSQEKSDSSEEKAAEEDVSEENMETEEKDADKSGADEEKKVIESIRMTEKDLNGAQSLQEKITKSIRDIFGSGRKEANREEKKEEKKSEDQEEMIRQNVEKEEFDLVPQLEKEGEKLVAAAETIKVKELEIPDSMRRHPKEPVTKERVQLKKEPEFSFNLEDAILAAASAQGIEIPEEKKEEPEEAPDIQAPEAAEAVETEPEAEESEPSEKEEGTEEPKEEAPQLKEKPMVFLEEEEFLSEEDLQSAEDEFLNGPSGRVPEEVKGGVDQFGIPTEFDMKSEAPAAEAAGEMPEEEEVELEPRSQVLTEEEERMFTYFVNVPGMKEQLINTLTDVQEAAGDKTSKTGNIIVMGARESGKTRLIASLIPAISSELHLEAVKVAYVFADQINGKDISRIISKLAGGFLVIEDAHLLDADTAQLLDKAMDFRTDGLTVILEDEKIAMRKMIAKYPKLARKFTSTINIPVFTNDELVHFADVYAKENGYSIEKMGMLALYNSISQNQKEDEPMHIGAVKGIVDEAIARSQGGIRRFQRNISKKRVDSEGYVILYEKDFL